jgi:hypothetical protein
MDGVRSIFREKNKGKYPSRQDFSKTRLNAQKNGEIQKN